MKVSCTGQQAIFTVTDTGIGIPQADKERIFERFYRVDKSHSKQIGGTGLGLSIVKHGAAFHNATIELDSQLGSGTTITLFFPRSAETTALAEREALFDPLNVEIPGEAEAPMIQIRDTDPDSDDAYDANYEEYPEDMEEYSEDTEEYPEDAEEFPEDTEEYSEDIEEYPEDAEEFPEDTEEFSEDTEEYSEDAEEFSEDTEEYSENTEEYSEDIEEFLEDTEEYSEDTEDFSEVAEEYSEDTEDFSEDAEEYPEDTEDFSEDAEEYPEDEEDYPEDTEDGELLQGTLFDLAEETDSEPEPAAFTRRLSLDETDRLLNEAVAALELEPIAGEKPEENAAQPENEKPEFKPAEPEPERRRPRRIDMVPLDEDNMDIRI